MTTLCKHKVFVRFLFKSTVFQRKVSLILITRAYIFNEYKETSTTNYFDEKTEKHLIKTHRKMCKICLNYIKKKSSNTQVH